MDKDREKELAKSLLAVLALGCCSVCGVAAAQKNLDTPNLDFSQGEEGWTYQTGWYTTPLKGETSECTYFWDRTGKGATDKLKDLSVIKHDGGADLDDVQKARFWRFDSPVRDGKFSFVPLSVLPAENQGGVMRIGRPEVWVPQGGTAGTYTLMSSMGGLENVDSDGAPFTFIHKVTSMMSGLPLHCSGAEASAISRSIKKKGDEWNYPYYSEPKAMSTPWAAAERMYYDFKVTENSTMLIYRFLAVLSSSATSAHHSSNGHPEMVVNVKVKNESTKQWELVPSNEHHLIASPNNKLNYPGVKPMYADLSVNPDVSVAFETDGLGDGASKADFISANCGDPENHSNHHVADASGCFINYATIDYEGGVMASRLHASGWRTRCADLRKYIGRTIRVEVLNHDCLMNDQLPFAVVAGDHSSYGYFQAETCRMEIVSDEKEKRDTIALTAPDGFPASAYSWSRESGGEILQDSARANVAYVDRETLVDGERYFCRIHPDSLVANTTPDLELSIAFSSFLTPSSETPLVNADTPNLDFSQGETGWTFQTGWYTTPVDGGPKDGKYIWSQTAKGNTSLLKGVDLVHNEGLTLGVSEKSHFLRFSNPQERDRIFSFLPLFVMPEENQSGVMRIGRPDVWKPSDGIGGKYTMKSVLGGPGMVDSDGKPYGSSSTQEDFVRDLRTFDTGCEAMGMSQERTASEWSHPFCDANDKTKMPWAGAERMYYDFEVTENTSLLIYRFLAVISSPEHCVNHRESGLPGMTVRVLLKNEMGKWVEIPCNDYKATASVHNSLVSYPEQTRMFGTLSATDAAFLAVDGAVGADLDSYISTNCISPANHASHAVSSDECFLNYATTDSGDGVAYCSRFHQTGWRTRFADLSAYVGRTVRVEVLNHDCLEMPGVSAKSVVAGGHNSYGYFQAETMRKEIRVPNCVGEYSAKIVLEAPKGFPDSSYSWSRQDGKLIEQDSLNPHRAFVDRLSVSESEQVFCKIDLDSTSENACTQFELSAEIDPVAVRPDAALTWECGGEARFEDASLVLSGDDEIVSWRWDFPDGSFSTEKDASFRFDKPKTKYMVTLTVGSTKGCNVMRELEVTTPYFVPDEWQVGSVYVCDGEEFILDASSLDEECEYSWYYLADGSEELLAETGSTLTARCDGKEGVSYKVKARIGTCDYERTMGVTALRKPILDVEKEIVVCQNVPLVLSVADPAPEVAYSWLSVEESSTHDGAEWAVGPRVPGEYSYLLKARQAYEYDETYTCSDSLKVSVVVNPVPVLRLNDQPLGCTVGPVRFFAEMDEGSSSVVASEYSWYLDGELTETKTSECEFSHETLPLGEHTVGLMVRDVNDCVSELVENTFSLRNPLNAYVRGDSLACVGDSLRYTAYPSGASYVWNDDPLLTESTLSLVATEGISTVKVSIAMDGCEEDVFKQVVVHPLPELHIDKEKSDSVVTMGMQANLTAVSADADRIKSWTWSPGGMVGDAVSLPVDNTTTFQVKVIDENGCVSTAEHEVVAKMDPPAEISEERIVCYGEPVQLTAADSLLEYVWRVRSGVADSVMATSKSVVTFVPTSDCYVYVNPKASEGAEAEEKVIKITVLPLPHLAVKGNKEICDGDDLDLTAEGAVSYQWSSESETYEGARLNLPSPTSVIYNLAGVSEYGCKASLVVPVKVNPLPSLDIEDPTAVCPGEIVRLKAVSSTCVAYRWGDGSTSDVCDVRAERDTPYTLQGVDENGCKVTVSKTIPISEAPTLVVDGDTLVCYGSSAHIWVEGDASSTWLWSTGETTSEISLQNLTEEQTVWVRKTSDLEESACRAEAFFRVKVRPLPTLSTVEKPFVCKGETLTTLHAQGAEYLKWDSNAEPGAELVLGEIMEDRTERLRGVDEYGCASEVDITIELKTPPSLRLVGSSEVCRGSISVFKARGADYYEWEDGSTSDSLAIRINDTDTITLYGRNEFGCQSSASKVVRVRSSPLIEIVGDTAVCDGGTVSIVATSTMSSISSVEWIWGDGTTTSKYTVTPEESFMTTVSAIGNRCTTVRNVNVIVLPLPELVVEGDTTLCEGDTLRLKASGASSYVWSDGSRSDYLEVEPVAGIYTLKGTDVHKCTSSIDVPVVVSPLPSLSLSAPTSLCPGSVARLLVKSDDCVSYLWEDGSVSDYRDVEAVEGAVYKVKGFGADGCSAVSSVELDVLSKPELNLSGDKTVCQGGTASFEVSSPDVLSWEWSTGSTDSSILLENVEEDQSLWVAGVYGVGGSVCVEKEWIDLVVRPLPSLTVKEDPKVCLGGDLKLHAQGADSYRWLSNGTEDYELVLENVTENRTELLMGVDEYGCADTIEVPIMVRESPIVAVAGPDKACEEDSILLQGSGASRYEWQHNGSIDSKQEFIAYYTNTYTLYGWDEFGCRGEASKFIEVNPTPEITLSGETSLCSGEALRIEASSTVDSTVWRWDDGSTAPVFTQVADTSREVSVRATFRGCFSEKSMMVNVAKSPELKVEGNTELRWNEELHLRAEGALSYVWQGPGVSDTGAVLSVPNPSTSIYRLTGKSASGCESSLQLSVVVEESLSLKIEGPSAACVGDTVRLLAVSEGCETFLWSTGEVGEFIDVVVYEDAVYEVVGTSGSGASVSAVKEVVAVSHPLIEISGSDRVCFGGSVSLLASCPSIADWEWSTGDATPSITLDSLLSDTTVWVVGVHKENGATCVSKVAHKVTLLTSPHIVVSGVRVVCPGDDLTLEAQGGLSYVWESESVEGSTLQLTNLTENRVVTLVGTNADGCASVYETVVEVAPLPSLKMDAPLSVCAGERVTLQAEGALEYQWQDDTTETAQRTLTLDTTTTFRLYGWNEYGCRVQEERTVVVRPLPQIEIKGNALVCEGDSVRLKAHSDLSSVDWLWADGGTSPFFSLLPVGDTLVSVVATADGCSSELSLSVGVLKLPELRVVGKTLLCEGERLELTAEGASFYEWADSDTSIAGASYSTADPVSMDYSLVGIDKNGCRSSLIIPVVVHPTPEISVDAPDFVCEGASLCLRANSSSCISYVWNDSLASDTMVVKIDADSVFTVKGVDENGCAALASKEVATMPVPHINLFGDTAVCAGDTLLLQAVSDNPSTVWRWSDGSEEATVVVRPERDETFAVVASLGECSVVDSIDVKVNALPQLSFEGAPRACVGGGISLLATGAKDYYWNGVAANPLVDEVWKSGDYLLKGVADNGCHSEMLVRVEALDLPKVSIEADTLVCEGLLNRLVAVTDGDYSYLWDDDSHSQDSVLVVEANSTRRYGVTVTDKSDLQCTASASVVVETYEKPMLLRDTTVCLGDSLVLRADFTADATNAEFLWNCEGKVTNDSILRIPSVTEPVKVLLRVHEKGMCVERMEIQVAPVDVPQLKILGDGLPVCDVREVTLVAFDKSNVSNNIRFEWSVDGRTVSQGYAYKSEYAQSTLLQLSGIVGGCVARKDTLLEVHPTPEVEFSGSTTICTNDSLRLVASKTKGDGILDYVWTYSDMKYVVGDVFVKSLEAGMHALSLSAVDRYGCPSESLRIPVSVRQSPAVEVASAVDGVVEVCRGLPLKLKAVGNQSGLSYAWSEDGGVADELAISEVDEAKTYSVTAFDGFCSDTAVVEVLPLEVPVVHVPDQRLCPNIPATILPPLNDEVLSYSFKYGDYEQKNVQEFLITPMPEESTLYLYPTGVNGCVSTTPTEVKIKAGKNPFVEIEGAVEVCKNSMLKLSPNVSNSPRPLDYYWVDEQGGIYSGELSLPMSEAGERRFTLRLPASDTMECYKDSVVVVTVHDLPKFEVGGEDEVCVGADAVLEAFGSLSPLSYKWYAEDPGLNAETPLLSSTHACRLPNVQDTALVYVVGSDGRCRSTVSHKVRTLEKPKLAYSGDAVLCEGSVATLVADGQAQGILYAWNGQRPTGRALYRSGELISGQPETVKLTAVKGDCYNDTLVVLSANPLPQLILPEKEVFSGEVFTMTYELADASVDVVAERWYSRSQLLGGRYAAEQGGVVEQHPWHTSFNTDVTMHMPLRLEVETREGCVRSVPVQVTVKEPELKGRYFAFNVSGQLLGDVYLNSDVSVMDQLSHFKSYQIVFLRSYDDESKLIKVWVAK